MPSFLVKSVREKGELKVYRGEREYTCMWTLYANRTLAVSVRTSTHVMMKRLTSVAIGANLARIAQNAATELVGGP